MSEVSGTIFNIQRFSIHDGPGIRTTVFLKGCPLRCFWCHNPEGMRVKAEIQFYPEKCIYCGECVQVCEHEGHQLAAGGSGHAYVRENCVACGECADGCCAGALQLAGEQRSAQAVVAEVMRDRAFYNTSGGGVTLSGGEPLLQRAFTRAVLEGCRLEGIHTAIETTAFFPWETIAEFMPLVDLVMMDIKHIDPEKHRWATGVSNERILANARRIAASGKPLLFRTPVIPTVNATLEEIGAIGAFVAELQSARPSGSQAIGWDLLPFHRLASDKYRSLGLAYPAGQLEPPGKELLAALGAVARGYVPEAVVR
jgi:pyruvate formate lyase activating enzyme